METNNKKPPFTPAAHVADQDTGLSGRYAVKLIFPPYDEWSLQLIWLNSVCLPSAQPDKENHSWELWVFNFLCMLANGPLLPPNTRINNSRQSQQLPRWLSPGDVAAELSLPTRWCRYKWHARFCFLISQTLFLPVTWPFLSDYVAGIAAVLRYGQGKVLFFSYSSHFASRNSQIPLNTYLLLEWYRLNIF